MNDIGYFQKEPTPLYYDYQVAIQLVINLKFQKCTKHIHIQYYTLCEFYQHKNLVYVCTQNQAFVILTKYLSTNKFHYFHNMFNLQLVIEMRKEN